MLGEKELYKGVEKLKLSTLLPEHTFPPGFDHAVVDEDENILNFCSSRYALVKNELIFKPIEEHFKALGIEYIRTIKIINKSKFYVDYIIKQRKDNGEVSGMFPKISVWNSYDGGSMMRHEFGFFRLLSSNNMTRPNGACKKDIFRHAVGEDAMTIQEKIEQIVDDSKEFVENASNDIELFKKLSEVKVTKKKIAAVAKKLSLSKKIVAAAEAKFDEEVKGTIQYKNEYGEEVTHKGCNRNLFTLYAALNYGIYNVNLKELPEKKIEKDRKLINYLCDIVD